MDTLHEVMKQSKSKHTSSLLPDEHSYEAYLYVQQHAVFGEKQPSSLAKHRSTKLSHYCPLRSLVWPRFTIMIKDFDFLSSMHAQQLQSIGR